MSRRNFVALWCLAALVLVGQAGPEAPLAQERRPFAVTAAASALVTEGLAAAAPADPVAAGYEAVPPPGVRFVPTVARATNVPWIDSNWWRYRRGLTKASYAALPEGSAALAAAEAFAQDAEAVLDPHASDLDDLRAMLRFLAAHRRPALPPQANIGVVDNGGPELEEVLNMLTRRNLLFQPVQAPDPALDLNIRIGSPEFPEDVAFNPYEFAQLVRTKLGDDRRLVRLYGTSTVLAHLTSGGGRTRLFLLQFTRGRRTPVSDNAQAVQVRLRGLHQPTGFAGYQSLPGAALSDLRHVDGATEFWVPDFAILAIVDLEARR